MSKPTTRRSFLESTVAGVTLGTSDLVAFAPLSSATAQEPQVTPDIVRYGPDIEPIVRLIETTPIERCPDMLIEQLRRGMSYRRFLAALFLAALRGPSTIAHSVFVIHSAHQLSLDAPVAERLLPLFWALNNYKYWSNWHAKNPSRLSSFKGIMPPEEKAEAEFRVAMEQDDHAKAEAALICLARSQGAHRVMELLWPYGAKDCVDIGHIAIALSSTWRVLPTIGWQHAEPILRWVLARLMSQGDATYRPNLERVEQSLNHLPGGWGANISDPVLTRDLLVLMRGLKVEEASSLVIARLRTAHASAGAVWDAIHLHAGEVMMRKADDGHSLHANTAANALHYAFNMSSDPAHRLLILLQAIGWQCQARRRKMETDPQWRASTIKIDDLRVVPIPDKAATAVEEIVSSLGSHPHVAAQKAFSLAQHASDADVFQQIARRLVVAKSTVNAHDIKFPIAIFEDYEQVAPLWRPHLMATSVYWLPGTEKPDSLVIQQAREAARTL